jgi:hypothetical protein
MGRPASGVPGPIIGNRLRGGSAPRRRAAGLLSRGAARLSRAIADHRTPMLIAINNRQINKEYGSDRDVPDLAFRGCDHRSIQKGVRT